MTDVLQLLRDADPAGGLPSYSDERMGTEVTSILARDAARSGPAVTDSDIVSIDLHPGRAVRGAGRRLVPALAAAAVVAAVAGGVLIARHDAAHTDAAGGGTRIACSVEPTVGMSIADRLASAERVMTHRVTALGGTVTGRSSDAGAGQVTLTTRGVSGNVAAAVCSATPVSVSPLVTSAVRQDATAPTSPTPLTTLTFTIPRSESAYVALDIHQRQALHAAMSRFDCSDVGAPTGGGALSCGPDGPARQVYLFARDVVTTSEFDAADAQPPSAAGGPPQWIVTVRLDRAGQSALGAYTSAHNIGGNSTAAATPSTCGPDGVPCADFLGYVVGGRVQVVAVTVSPISGGPVQLSGQLTRTTATRLADAVTAAAIGLAPAR